MEVTNEDSLERRAARPRIVYVVSEDLAKVASLLPSNRGRSALVHSLVSAFGLFRTLTSGLRVLKPTPASFKDLNVYHDKNYLDFVLNEAETEGAFGVRDGTSGQMDAQEYGLEDDCPHFTGLPDYVRMVAGASLTAASALHDDEADIAICWDGGRHHAHKAKASGFCYVADCVLSILSLRKIYPRPRIMYLDLDLHMADAVTEAFYSPSSTSSSPVLTLSIHHASKGFFPASPRSSLSTTDTEDPFSLSIPLESGASNATFARVWKSAVEPVKEAFKPDFVILQCGADGLAGDPCAVFNWSINVEDEGSMGWCVQQALNWKCKTLLLGGGGYNSPNTARAWTHFTSIACGRPLPVDTNIPDHRGFPMYKPSFTLDVPSGNMRDENTSEYLDKIDHTFKRIAERICDRMNFS